MTEPKLHSEAGSAKEPMSGLEPLTSNLITSDQSGVQGIVQACKCPLSNPLLIDRLAEVAARYSGSRIGTDEGSPIHPTA
jgi:hypothetical protein